VLKDILKAQIVARASGVFLWVVLVVSRLREAADHGTKLMTVLNSIPAELEDLFNDIFIRTKTPTERASTLLMAQCILYSRRPLSPSELFLALEFSNDECPRNTSEIQCRLSGRDSEFRRFDRYVKYISGGLFEIRGRPSTGEEFDRDCRVQVIHESVRDYLRGIKGLKTFGLNPEGDSLKMGNKVLARSCKNYLQLQELSDVVPLPPFEKGSIDQIIDYFYHPFELSKPILYDPFSNYVVSFLFDHQMLSQSGETFGSARNESMQRWVNESVVRWMLLYAIGLKEFGLKTSPICHLSFHALKYQAGSLGLPSMADRIFNCLRHMELCYKGLMDSLLLAYSQEEPTTKTGGQRTNYEISFCVSRTAVGSQGRRCIASYRTNLGTADSGTESASLGSNETVCWDEELVHLFTVRLAYEHIQTGTSIVHDLTHKGKRGTSFAGHVRYWEICEELASPLAKALSLFYGYDICHAALSGLEFHEDEHKMTLNVMRRSESLSENPNQSTLTMEYSTVLLDIVNMWKTKESTRGNFYQDPEHEPMEHGSVSKWWPLFGNENLSNARVRYPTGNMILIEEDDLDSLSYFMTKESPVRGMTGETAYFKTDILSLIQEDENQWTSDEEPQIDLDLPSDISHSDRSIAIHKRNRKIREMTSWPFWPLGKAETHSRQRWLSEHKLAPKLGKRAPEKGIFEGEARETETSKEEVLCALPPFESNNLSPEPNEDWGLTLLAFIKDIGDIDFHCWHFTSDDLIGASAYENLARHSLGGYLRSMHEADMPWDDHCLPFKTSDGSGELYDAMFDGEQFQYRRAREYDSEIWEAYKYVSVGMTKGKVCTIGLTRSSSEPPPQYREANTLSDVAGARGARLNDDRMGRLKELIRGKSATSLNTGEHVTSSRGGTIPIPTNDLPSKWRQEP
jgi:hypothetical protein